jgi:uncharacterized MAPEG superfamily protein
MWTLVLLIAGIGVPRVSAVLMGRAEPKQFRADVPQGSERYQRTMRAHMNCVENLPVFAALVLLGSSLGITGPLFQVSAALVFPARVLQSLTHVASGRNRAVNARFGFFSVQLACFFLMAASIVLHSA